MLFHDLRPRANRLIYRALERHYFWASENLSGDWLCRLTDRYCDAVHRLRIRFSPRRLPFDGWRPLSPRYWELEIAQEEATRAARAGDPPAWPFAPDLVSGPRPPDYNDGTRDHV